jgi:diguanylate cyclase (GGDEF)-like protein
VLHATGPDLRPPDPTEVERLNVLARETGARLGTMRATQQTEMQASTDGLTGLPNRRSLETAARELITVDRPFAIAMADLDHFKDLNDTYGHEAGDRALKLFAKTMRQNLRPDDTAARYGGEEFLLLLPNTSIEEAKRALDRLRVTLAGEIAATGSVPFTASWGLTTNNAGTTFDEMVVAADEALYAAKRAGRNRVIVGEGGGPAEAFASLTGFEEEPAPEGQDEPVTEVATDEAATDATTDEVEFAELAPSSDTDMATCPECGSDNPEGSRFCLECGTQLTAVVQAD